MLPKISDDLDRLYEKIHYHIGTVLPQAYQKMHGMLSDHLNSIANKADVMIIDDDYLQCYSRTLVPSGGGKRRLPHYFKVLLKYEAVKYGPFAVEVPKPGAKGAHYNAPRLPWNGVGDGSSDEYALKLSIELPDLPAWYANYDLLSNLSRLSAQCISATTNRSFRDYLDAVVFKRKMPSIDRAGSSTRNQLTVKKHLRRADGAAVSSATSNASKPQTVVADGSSQRPSVGGSKRPSITDDTPNSKVARRSSSPSTAGMMMDSSSPTLMKSNFALPKDNKDFVGIRMKRSATDHQGYIIAVEGRKFVVKWVSINDLDGEEMTEFFGKIDVIK